MLERIVQRTEWCIASPFFTIKDARYLNFVPMINGTLYLMALAPFAALYGFATKVKMHLLGSGDFR